ncbi:MAG: C-terminal binding protein [Acidimicrobiia bacterium]|nr:C-terminal binding protein [Acidimicrobiia bacterium]
MTTVAVLDTTYPDLGIEQGVLDGHGIALHRENGSSPAAIAACADAEVIIVGSRARFDAAALDSVSARAIVRAGIGVETIDLDAATAAGIVVCNVPDYGTETVAQHALALALAGTRRLIEADRMVRRGEWGFQSTRPMHLPSSSTAGVLGLGRIGRRVAELFAAVGFGAVIGHDPFIDQAPEGVQSVDLDDLLERSDVLSIHIPGNTDGSPAIGARELERMKAGSVLVNTARGTLIDNAALACALRAGRPRIAALDVFTVEPPDLAEFADTTDRLILSPHQAWYTEESQTDLRRKSAEEALRIITGRRPLNPVGPVVGNGGRPEPDPRSEQP